MLIKNRVRELRAIHKLTQEDLAEKVNVTRQTIAAIEKQDYIPSLLLGLNICEVFEVKMEELFWLGGENIEK
ncbi:helix-turn-helix transcriptional regulator [Jeotgalibacillus sp. ET6]|uniref:helix-turn-helix transcriptional regulator n=1 Tax=Jeotgalibacillus sp. ET6 TaxID=3037260 RepID=UPI002418B24E|nr:helix-turn-helix transcriptional regulator [Jeotgalibacillus sp. ET6]MDG5471948.1 helix-turn-helix transcriptional regulator [Jeotgalibacillus sp. ET6]